MKDLIRDYGIREEFKRQWSDITDKWFPIAWQTMIDLSHRMRYLETHPNDEWMDFDKYQQWKKDNPWRSY